MTPRNLVLFLQLRRAQAAASRRFDAELGAVHGLGLNDLVILLQLEQAPEQRLRRIDLAERLLLTASGVTRLLGPLERIGLVGQLASEVDARATYATLTRAGRQRVKEARTTAARIADQVLGALKLGQRAQLAELLALLPEGQSRLDEPAGAP